MTWNYRMLKVAEDAYSIIEAFYDEEGEIKSWTEAAVAPSGDTKEELILDLKMMLHAQSLPVVEELPFFQNGNKLVEIVNG